MAERRPVNKISSRRPVERTSRSVRRTGTPSTGTRGIVAMRRPQPAPAVWTVVGPPR